MTNIFIASAHTRGAPLPQLVNEIRIIEKVLQPLKERGSIGVISNRAANVDDIFHTFTTEKNIQVFHYAGHADGESLHLEEKGNIKGIAELFGLSGRDEKGNGSLRFAFINGCSSAGQVESLHKAGVEAVIATIRPIEDQAALTLAKQFYRTWSIEGKKLKDAFDTAIARVKTTSGVEFRGGSIFTNEISNYPFSGGQLPWGLYINPGLENTAIIENWVLNKRPKLPPMFMEEVRPNANQSLRELVHAFRKSDAEAQQIIRNERKDPLMVLIERLPWIVGTHLRRLFAAEEGKTMAEPGIERLKELITAYSELTRFISYLTLTMLWDAKREGFDIPELPFELVPDEEEFKKTDYVFHIREHFKILDEIDNTDPLQMEPKIGQLLQTIDDENGLRPDYLIMEEWKHALAESDERFAELVNSRTTEAGDDIKKLVLEAETMYARFLKASLFLTHYQLHTVRSVVVDKIRNLNDEQPYSHYTISLHAAFSQLQSSLTVRETATDSYCLLLTPRNQSVDKLANAINLSPFYIDRSSFIGNSTNSYPAIFVLDYCRKNGMDKEYVFHYIDADVNHNYAFAKDNQLVIDPFGATLPDHMEVAPEEIIRFERIYEQFEQMDLDIPHGNN